MNVGDIVIDMNDKQWIIYSVDVLPESEIVPRQELYYVTDFASQKEQLILTKEEIKEVIEKPSNTSFLFLKRKMNNLVDIKEYL